MNGYGISPYGYGGIDPYSAAIRRMAQGYGGRPIGQSQQALSQGGGIAATGPGVPGPTVGPFAEAPKSVEWYMRQGLENPEATPLYGAARSGLSRQAAFTKQATQAGYGRRGLAQSGFYEGAMGDIDMAQQAALQQVASQIYGSSLQGLADKEAADRAIAAQEQAAKYGFYGDILGGGGGGLAQLLALLFTGGAA